MKITIINETKLSIPKKFIEDWLGFLDRDLKKRKVRKFKTLAKAHMSVVCLLAPKAKKLNRDYRKRNYATDILSFDGDGRGELGDLVLCWPVLKRQAKEHGLTFKQELAYLLTHGVLHLLGYDHELSRKESEVMLSLQDKIFATGIAKLKEF